MSVRNPPAGAALRLRVRVVPGARRSEVVGRLGETWKLRVAAPPERGRANGELVALLARTLRIPRTAVRVARGQTTREKLVEVQDLSHDEAEALLAAAGKERA